MDFQYTLILSDEINRDELIKYLQENEIESRVYYPIHKQPLYQKLGYKENCPIAEGIITSNSPEFK